MFKMLDKKQQFLITMFLQTINYINAGNHGHLPLQRFGPLGQPFHQPLTFIRVFLASKKHHIFTLKNIKNTQNFFYLNIAHQREAISGGGVNERLKDVQLLFGAVTQYGHYSVFKSKVVAK